MNNISKVYSSYEQVPTYRKHTKPFLTLTITLLLLLTGNSRAENQLIEDIRAYYYPLSEAIEIAKGDDEDEEETPSSLKEERSVEHGESFGELYSTEIFFNSNNMTTCGAGHVDKKIIFWYSKQWPDQPKPKPLIAFLQKIIIKETAGPREYYTEYVFKEGELIFYFNKDPDKSPKEGESRFYYHQGKAIRYMEEQKIYNELSTSQQKMALSIQREAKKYQELSLTLYEEFSL